MNIRGRSLNLIGDLSKLVPRNGYGQLAFTVRENDYPGRGSCSGGGSSPY